MKLLKIIWEMLVDFFYSIANGSTEYYPDMPPKPTDTTDTQNTPPEAPEAPTTSVNPKDDPDIILPWTTPENCRHNVRAICDLAGLSVKEKNLISQVVHCESNYNPHCVHENVVGGKVSSTDFGIVQVNDYWWIGKNKRFPTAQYVLDNPQECVEWMIERYKQGYLSNWVCYSKNLYVRYSA